MHRRFYVWLCVTAALTAAAMLVRTGSTPGWGGWTQLRVP